MPVREVAIVSVAMTEPAPPNPATTSIENVFDVAQRAVVASGLHPDQIELRVTASSDMLEGRPFNFVKGLEAVGAWPAKHVRHVEMEGAWGAYEAWVSLLGEEFDSALIVAWGRASEASLHHVFNSQLDPFTLAPLGLDHLSTAALQADACGAPFEAPRFADGACAIVLAAGAALRACEPLAWVRGADHRSESGALGHRDLSAAPSARLAFERAASLAGWSDPDLIALHAPFAHQAAMLLSAFEQSGNNAHRDSVEIPMVSGLMQLARASQAIERRALAHASAGHALQQNMVWLVEKP